MDVLARVIEIIEQPLSMLDYEIIQVKLVDNTRRKTLTIMAERKDRIMMSFDDCTKITNTVSALIDVESPISGAYNLEVCSPGVDRPLVKREDYSRFVDHEIKVETIIPINERKRFRGILKGIEDDKISLLIDNTKVELPFLHIRIAKLVMNDELIATFLKKPKFENNNKDC